MHFALAAFFYSAFVIYRYAGLSLTSRFNSGILFQEVTEDEINKSPLLDFGVRTYIH